MCESESSFSSSSTTKRDLLHGYWCFTFNNYEDSDMDLLDQLFRHECEWFVFQEEKGEEGTPHLQGTLKLKKRVRLSYLKKLHGSIHWEATKAVKSSIVYCTKEATRNGKIISYGIQVKRPVKVYEPRGWQLEIIDIIKEEPDDRSIYWYWEPKGNLGKTQICKYLIKHKLAFLMDGLKKDMACAIKDHINELNAIVINLCRSEGNDLSYSGLESIKDGLIFNTKYQSGGLIFNSPHVFVFANSPPQCGMLSKDRLIVRLVEGI